MTLLHREALTGKEIKRLRKQLGASCAQLAEMLCIARQTVFRWEQTSGKLPPIGLAQQQLLVLFGRPSKQDADRIMGALRAGGVPAVWAYLTGPFNLMPARVAEG
jgi:DNA-binding XRE family transcriptional regulator